MTATPRETLQAVWRALGRDHTELSIVAGPRHPVPLSSRTDVPALAWASVAAASLAAARIAGAPAVDIDPDRVALAYASERRLLVDGTTPEAFAPLSGFFRTSDGWVRTHGNYAWHADALRGALGLGPDDGKDAATAALARTRAADAAAAITKAGGICAAVRAESPASDAQWRTRPLVQFTRIGDGAARPLPAVSASAPLRGIRVLDLTRVIAGPVATRTLALLGADVLRVDPPGRPELASAHFDTGHGKRSTVLDARSARFAELLESADVLVLGYRPTGLDALGLAPGTVAARHPAIVIARLSAWGLDEGDRRGFDSIVQAASGLSWAESADGETPGVLPAQALDHSAGYLLAAAVITLLARRAHEGGTWLAETSLRRIAAELLGMPRTESPPDFAPVDPGPHTRTFAVGASTITTVAPAIAYEGGPTEFAAPHPWGADEPVWRAG